MKGENLWVDVGTNPWKKCQVTTGTGECIVIPPGDVMGVPVGWCFKNDNATRYTGATCTTKAQDGPASVGPSSCETGVGKSTPCPDTP